MAHATDLIPRLQQVLPAILDERPVLLAYLYGSVSSGLAMPFSDVDIALYLSESLEPRQRLHLELDVEIALEDRLGLPNADVRVINDAPLMVRGTVVQEGRLLYSRDEESRIEFEMWTRKLYLDYKPTADMFRRLFFERLREQGFSYGRSKKTIGDTN